jgi:hypothetical protein
MSSCGDALCIRVAVLFPRTSVGHDEKAGEAARFGSGLNVCFGLVCVALGGSCACEAGALVKPSCTVELEEAVLCLCKASNVWLGIVGGVLIFREFDTCACGGEVMVGATVVGAKGDSVTELTWTRSSWKSAGSSMGPALSFRSTPGPGSVGLAFGRGLLAGLVCRGRGGGGNS